MLWIVIVKHLGAREISEFYLVEVFLKDEILIIFLKISIFVEKIEIEKKTRKEKNKRREREGSCSTSYSSGNQVDGLPLVALLRE